MTGWDWLWIVWIGYFLAVEGTALVCSRKNDTLSELFWRYLHIGKSAPPAGRAVWVIRVMTLAFGVWLVLHMAFGWFGGGMFPRLW
ncbi:MAG: hypothetical protein ACOYEV_19915 [Candidatus Nanopelagicales bacterium]